MKLRLAITSFAFVLAAAAFATPQTDTVVLLHGLGRTRWSMARIAGALETDGYRVLNATYPSRRLPLERLATEWLPAQLAEARPDGRVHFVTHSMGGILVRVWLRDHAVPPTSGAW